MMSKPISKSMVRLSLYSWNIRQTRVQCRQVHCDRRKIARDQRDPMLSRTKRPPLR